MLDAQDTLVKIWGEKLPSKILEVTDTYVLYKPFEAPDSINIMVSTDEVSRLHFSNGEKHVLPHPKSMLDKYKISYVKRQYVYQHLPVSASYLYKVLAVQNDTVINLYIRESKKLRLTSAILAFSGIPILGSMQFVSLISNQQETRVTGAMFTTIVAAVIGVEVSAIIFTANHKKKMVKAVNRYNKNIFE